FLHLDLKHRSRSRIVLDSERPRPFCRHYSTADVCKQKRMVLSLPAPCKACLLPSRWTTMENYEDIVALARICLKQSRQNPNSEIGCELVRLAKEYQRKAADMDEGKIPDIGENEFPAIS